MLHIDGSYGEGGGQVLRSSLALSLVTGRPFTIEKIRAGRSKPGLMRQHLTAVRAAVEVGGAEVRGADIGSGTLRFTPNGVFPGEYHFAVGTAGSATLVLQTVLPALIMADGPSELVLEGGTHNPYAPPFHFLEQAFLPLMGRIGSEVKAVLERPGFYPAGGGRFTVHIEPVRSLTPLDLIQRGPVHRRVARGIVARLPRRIAETEASAACEILDWPRECALAEEAEKSYGPGNILTIEIESEHVTEVFTGFGQRGVPAEKVAQKAALEAGRYLESGAPVGPHLADQLIVPYALAKGGCFRTVPLTRHTETNIAVVRQFLDVRVDAKEINAEVWELSFGDGRG